MTIFKKFKFLERQSNINIQVNRDSVCMGDDCNSHATQMTLPKSMMLSDLLQRLSDYVPSMENVVWAVHSDLGICGYLISDSNNKISTEIYGTDETLEKRKISRVICKYYYPSIFSWLDGQSGKMIDKYAECYTFLEKVKKDNEHTK